MSEILSVTDSVVKVGTDDGSIIEAKLSSIQYPNPNVGDKVKIFSDKSTTIIKLDESATDNIVRDDGSLRKVNKIAYILLTFFLGGIGVHRFLRGQVGLGIVMILFGWLTLGIWWLIDFIISLTKLSAYPGEDYVFTRNGMFTK